MPDPVAPVAKDAQKKAAEPKPAAATNPYVELLKDAHFSGALPPTPAKSAAAVPGAPRAQAPTAAGTQVPKAQVPNAAAVAPAKSPAVLPALPNPREAILNPPGEQQEKKQEIPKAILEKAAGLGFAPNQIKAQSGLWIGCSDTACVPLGKVTGDKTTPAPRAATPTPLPSAPTPTRTVQEQDSATRPAGATAAEARTAKLAAQLQNLPLGSSIEVVSPAPGMRAKFTLNRAEASAGGNGFSIPGFGSFARNQNGTYRFAPAKELATAALRVTLPNGATVDGNIPGTSNSTPANGAAAQGAGTRGPVTNGTAPNGPQTAAAKTIEADFNQAREYIRTHPNEPILVLGTVPALCPPCRALEQSLPSVLSTLAKEGRPVTLLRLEYQDFDSGKAEFGQGAGFPMLAVFGRGERGVLRGSADPQGAPVLQGLGGLRNVFRGEPANLLNLLRNAHDSK